jgi:Gpi18-like mannosyltransferase
MKASVRTILLIWLAWVLALIGFQAFAAARYQPARPDRVLEWTPQETTAKAQDDQPYLIDPFMNHQVSWDSEFYLSIANAGYDDPRVRTVRIGTTGEQLSLNYAFMPFYPHVMRVVSWPLRLLGLTPIATLTLAGVIVSTLGTLGGMLALYDIAREELDEAGGIRAAFYLIAFPTGFFLAQVYTEGLFVGLAFGCLAMLRRKRIALAALLAAFAAWTRAVGAILIIPLAYRWIKEGEWMDLDLEWKQIYLQGFPWKALGRGLLGLSPLVAYIVWRSSYWGAAFGQVEAFFFGRGFLSLGPAFISWIRAAISVFGDSAQTTAYYLVELSAIIFGIVACIATWRRYPSISAFSLAAILLSLTSGPAQGMHRYVLAAPSVFLFLSRLGRNEAFDRAWSIFSILLMGLLATLFTFDMWVG